MSISEWIWTRIGFTLLATLSASVWGLMFYPLVSAINPEISLSSVMMAFIGTFVVISMINENWIEKAGLGAIFALWGAIHGIFSEGGHAQSDPSWRVYGAEMAICFCLGLASTIFLLW